MAKNVLLFLSLLLVFVLFHCPNTSAQPAAAPAQPALVPPPQTAPPKPAQAPPPLSATPPAAQTVQQVPPQRGRKDVVKILGKAGQFAVFIRLLKGTGVADQLKGQLNNSRVGFTIFAPNDGAFSNLKAGTLNSLSDLQKTQLIQYHILSTYVSLSNFQTLSNPVPTEAGDTSAGEFPLNLTTAGTQVNISTGLVNTTLGGTVYSDNQLAIYGVSKVLLPQDIFVPKPPAPAKSPAASKTKPKPGLSTAETPSTDATVAQNLSGAVSLSRHGMLVFTAGVALVAFFLTKGT